MMTAMTSTADADRRSGGGPLTMRAAILRRHGAPPECGSHPAPRRGPGEALIRVTAAPINPLDLLCASGTSYFGAPALPYVPGTQGVGIVEEADGILGGQRVWFSATAGMRPGDGSMAQWCVVPESAALPVTDGISDDLAAALGLSAIAAWMALTWRGGLQPGEHVLVLGASGNVGQIAERRGLSFSTSSHEKPETVAFPTPRCSEKGCVFPASSLDSGKCSYHMHQEEEPVLFCSHQPTGLLLDPTRTAPAEKEYDGSRKRDRRRMAAIWEQFQSDGTP